MCSIKSANLTQSTSRSGGQTRPVLILYIKTPSPNHAFHVHGSILVDPHLTVAFRATDLGLCCPLTANSDLK